MSYLCAVKNNKSMNNRLDNLLNDLTRQAGTLMKGSTYESGSDKLTIRNIPYIARHALENIVLSHGLRLMYRDENIAIVQ